MIFECVRMYRSQCSGDLNADLCDRRMNNGVRVCLVQGASYNSKERQKERRDEVTARQTI